MIVITEKKKKEKEKENKYVISAKKSKYTDIQNIRATNFTMNKLRRLIAADLLMITINVIKYKWPWRGLSEPQVCYKTL